MSALYFLASDDFFVSTGSKGDMICHSVPGFAFVLYYSTQCAHCRALLPIFKKLPGTLGGCQFAIVNMDTNKEMISKSKNTITPIKFVPYMILYINGRPFMRYEGAHDLEEIRQFIVNIAQRVNGKQKFSKGEVQEEIRGAIPAYTIGQPLVGEDEDAWYKEFKDAYNAASAANSVSRM